MNSPKKILVGLALAACLCSQPLAQAQNSEVTLPATMGVLTRYTPEAIVINTSDSSRSITYSYTKATTYVDAAGNPVAMSAVQPGVPVTVFYENDGDIPIARKMVVGKGSNVAPESPTTGIVSIGKPGQTLNNQAGISPEAAEKSAPTPTPSVPMGPTSGAPIEGVVTWVTTNEIKVKTVKVTDPVNIMYTPSTTYTDERGNPFSKDLVVTGQQVMVYCAMTGDKMVANNVVVRREVGSNEPEYMRRRSAKQGPDPVTSAPASLPRTNNR